MNPYRLRVWAQLEKVFENIGPQESALDFGCGDGWFASKVKGLGTVETLVPLDVKRRDQVLVEPLIYDGGRLPFADRSFSICYSVDVLHHCPDPELQLREMARVSSQFIVIKDHTCRGLVGQAALAILDELGNRKFGIPSTYRYQRGWSWRAVMESEGWTEVLLEHPMTCHVGLLGWLTNRLQYLAVFERR